MSCTRAQSARLKPAASHWSTSSLDSASGLSTSWASSSVVPSRCWMRSRRSLSSKLALSWIACARRDDRMLLSITSSPISSSRSPPVDDAPAAAPGVFTDLRQLVWASETHCVACPWNATKSSRLSCMARALPTSEACLVRRSRMACARGTMTLPVASTKRSRVSRASCKEEADRAILIERSGRPVKLYSATAESLHREKQLHKCASASLQLLTSRGAFVRSGAVRPRRRRSGRPRNRRRA